MCVPKNCTRYQAYSPFVLGGGFIPEPRLPGMPSNNLTVFGYYLGETVTSLSPEEHLVHTSKGNSFKYDKCILATGSDRWSASIRFVRESSE